MISIRYIYVLLIEMIEVFWMCCLNICLFWLFLFGLVLIIFMFIKVNIKSLEGKVVFCC